MRLPYLRETGSEYQDCPGPQNHRSEQCNNRDEKRSIPTPISRCTEDSRHRKYERDIARDIGDQDIHIITFAHLSDLPRPPRRP